jgi:hypothetical protein
MNVVSFTRCTAWELTGMLALLFGTTRCGGTSHEQIGSGGGAGMSATGGVSGAGGASGSGSGGVATAGQTAQAGAGATSCEPATGRTCGGDLSNVGAGSFEIDFQLTTTSSAVSALLSQRSICTHAYFWDTRLVDGKINFELDDQGQNYSVCTSSASVNDGMPHWVAIRRMDTSVEIYIDCALDTTCDSLVKLDMPLPSLETGTSACVNSDGTVALTGSLSGTCVGKL